MHERRMKFLMGGPGFGMPFNRFIGEPPFGRGPRAARGNVRGAILVLLGEAPMHGYQIMQELERRSDGAWKPSPGSVYPTLQALEDEGLVRADERDGRRVFALTDAGAVHLDEHRDHIGTPWEQVADEHAMRGGQLHEAMGQLMGAVRQVTMSSNREQVEQAARVLSDARRQLYLILAQETASDPPA